MTHYVVLNYIQCEGVGDYSHFEDIIQNLLASPTFENDTFAALVCFSRAGKRSNYLRIEQKLKQIGIPYFYGDDEAHNDLLEQIALFKQNKPHNAELIASFQALGLDKTDKALVVSYGANLIDDYINYMPSDVSITYIGEHDINMRPDLAPNEVNRSLGLAKRLKNGEKTFGIKIAPKFVLDPEAAWHLIAMQHPQFIQQLEQTTGASDFRQLVRTHHIIPAYFNRTWDFIEFLRMFSINNSFTGTKDLVIYHSGAELISWLHEGSSQLPESKLACIRKLFARGHIKQIEIISATVPESYIIPGNANAQQCIKIMSGFYLDDDPYKALFHQAKIAGVSGDTTFERCISMDAFPFYWSTNSKQNTLKALREITQLPELDLSAQAREAYDVYFDYNSIDIDLHPNMFFSNYNKRIKPEVFSALNMQAMVDEWPKVTGYLREHKNFYDQLEGIVLENIRGNQYTI